MPDTEKPVDPVFTDKTLIKPIELDDAQGRWIFEPQADITALESALIAHMFSAIVVRFLKGDQSRFDWREYLTRDRRLVGSSSSDVNAIALSKFPDLARHFRKVEGC